MSIRFPTDNDPGISRQRAPRRPGGGGKIFFMLIVGVVAFMVMRGMSAGPQSPVDINPSDRSGGYGSTEFPDLQTEQPRADQSDWAMEEGPVKRNAASKNPVTKSSNSDWGMEDVATQRDANQPAGRFSQSANASVEELQKKQPTTNGDWSLDSDIESTPKLSEPKKTVKGDWGLEEVE